MTHRRKVQPLRPHDLCPSFLSSLESTVSALSRSRHNPEPQRQESHWNGHTHRSHRFVQVEPNSLDRYIPLDAVRIIFQERPQYPGGDETTSAYGYEQIWA